MKNLWKDIVCYSPIRQQWCVAFNQSGKIEDLHVWSWHDSKLDALETCLQKTRFREGMHADCLPWIEYGRQIAREILKLNSKGKSV